MTYESVIGTLALFVAVVGAIPGCIALKKVLDERRPRIRCSTRSTFYEKDSKLFLNIRVTPGAKPIRIVSVEAVSFGLASLNELSDIEQDPGSLPMTLDASTGPSEVNWIVPSRSEHEGDMYADFILSDSNIQEKCRIELLISWRAETNSRIKLFRQSTVTIRLINPNRQQITKAHAEIAL